MIKHGSKTTLCSNNENNVDNFGFGHKFESLFKQINDGYFNMSHLSLQSLSAHEPRKGFHRHQKELEIRRLQLLGGFQLKESRLLQDTDVRIILHEDDARTCPCVQVITLSGNFIFAFEGTLSVTQISKQVSSKLQVDVGRISLLSNDEALDDAKRLVSTGHSSLTAVIDGREIFHSTGLQNEGKGELKVWSKKCQVCGEQLHSYEHSWTPRCHCGFW